MLMTSRARAAIWVGLVVLAGGIACGGGSDDGGPPPSGRKTVIVANNTFQPATVAIEEGDTVLWSWSAGSIDHNVISFLTPTFTNKGTEVGAGGGTTGTDYFNAPASHQVIFPTAGEYWYFCSTHGNKDTTSLAMKGKVVVD
jgi:plastocyanin